METSNPTVLVVDDYTMNLKIAEFALKKCFNVLTAESGIDALEILKSNDIDVILLDILMPDMDGFDTYDELRKIEKYAFTPVCFLTGDTDENSIARMEEIGVPHLGKPFDPSQLLATVTSLLQ